MINDLDSPERIIELRQRIQQKPGLKSFYEACYTFFKKNVSALDCQGEVLELGSGAGFIKKHLPDVITSDIIAYEDIDEVVDALAIPFEDHSLKAILLMNVFHHIPDVSIFLNEASRVLKTGGSLIMVEPYPGWVGRPIYQHIHHENMNMHCEEWKFTSKSPLGDANNALAWIVFERDLKKFQTEFPQFRLVEFSPHSPFIYWLTGGLKKWTLLPPGTTSLAKKFDEVLINISPRFGSFVNIVVRNIN